MYTSGADGKQREIEFRFMSRVHGSAVGIANAHWIGGGSDVGEGEGRGKEMGGGSGVGACLGELL
jgi:hypothetical protein